MAVEDKSAELYINFTEVRFEGAIPVVSSVGNFAIKVRGRVGDTSLTGKPVVFRDTGNHTQIQVGRSEGVIRSSLNILNSIQNPK